MTEETKLSIKHFSLSSMTVVVMALSASIAFAGRTEYRLSQLEESKQERKDFMTEIMKSYDSQQVEKLKRIEQKVDDAQEEIKTLKTDVKQIYNLLITESKK